MNIEHYMTKDVITIDPNARITEAVDLMEKHDFHSLPVEKGGKFIGLVTDDLIQSKTSSSATSLSIYELNYLLDKTTSEQIMETNVITSSKATTVEEAADLMVKNNITVLPILDEQNQVDGIITYKDIFRALIELTGYKNAGDRFIVEITEDKIGVLKDLTSILSEDNISISHIFVNNINERIEITIQVENNNEGKAVELLEDHGYTIYPVK